MNYIQSKDEFLGEAVRVETSRYERVHGKKPKGFGQWAFYFDNMGGDPMFVPKAMNYSDAVKWAKGEAKKAGKREVYVGESVNEKRSTPYGELMLDIDAAMKKAIKNGVTTLRYAQDYVKSLERMAKKNAKRFFKDYGDFTEEDWIEDVRYNMANESVKDAAFNLDKIFGDDQESIEIFQDIEDNGTWEDMVNYIEEFGNEEMLSRYGIRSTAQVKKLAKHIMRESILNEKFREGQFIKSKVDSDNFSGDVYDVTNDVDGTEIDKGMTFRVGSVGRDEAIIFGADDEIEYSLDPKDLKKYFVKESINEGRAAADRLLKDVVKGNTSSIEGIKMSKEMAEAYLEWLRLSTYGKKFGKGLPFSMLFPASFNWGIERYGKGKSFKDELKTLKAKAKEMKESLTEGKGDKAVSMAQKKLDKVMSDLKANLLKFKGAKTDKDKETFKSEASRLTQLRKDAQAELDNAIQSAYADAELVIMENYDTEQRKEMAKKGLALPDGSFPIKTVEDLKNAIQTYGRAKDHSKAAKFIAKRAKALNAEDLIPDTEDFQKALKEAEFGRIPKFGE